VVLGASERLERWQARNWKCTTGPVKNLPLWAYILELKTKLNIKWSWVRGHDGDEFNEQADQAAVNEYKAILKKRAENLTSGNN
jgi:ribonuclease HI